MCTYNHTHTCTYKQLFGIGVHIHPLRPLAGLPGGREKCEVRRERRGGRGRTNLQFPYDIVPSCENIALDLSHLTPVVLLQIIYEITIVRCLVAIYFSAVMK